MKIHQLLVSTSILLMTAYAQASLNVCELQSIPVPADQNITQQSIADYQAKLLQECAVYQRYQELRSYEQQYNIGLDKIYLFQGIKYVDRYAYEKAKAKNIPIELIFQVNRADADKPIAERSDLVWRNWARGNQQLEQTKKDIQTGKIIDIPYLQKIQAGFFIENESSDQGNVGVPGSIKEPYYPNVSWDLKTQKEIDDYSAVSQKLDDKLKALDLRPQLPNAPDFENKIFDVRDGKLYPASPKAVRLHMANMLKFLNAVMAQARENKPMIWKNNLYTPMQVAYFVQQMIVQIHGFNDGNGRSSRFWQDVILAIFELPAGASGDLSYNDLTADEAEYYHRAQAKSYNDLVDVQKCYRDIYPKLLPPSAKEPGFNLQSVDMSRAPYDCRFLK